MEEQLIMETITWSSSSVKRSRDQTEADGEMATHRTAPVSRHCHWINVFVLPPAGDLWVYNLTVVINKFIQNDPTT